jgi:2-polyprenyl-3-methyl-5-hydroxy-6-metoxy-1,4-benzoquinol methylase
VPSGSSIVPQDAFTRWVALQAWSNDATNRLDEAVDLAFWERAAEDYDATALASRVPSVLDRVRQLVPAGASLLEVGAGTGAFTLSLSDRAGRITALDYSPAMLRVLRRKLDTSARSAHVHVLEARWEDAEVEPHDVVLAANALYRLAEPRLALAKLVAAARSRGIVVWSVGRSMEPPLPGYQPGPDYVHLVEALFALDVFAHVELIDRVAIVWWDRPAA